MGMFATREEAAERLRICFACEEITPQTPKRCRLCQCYMRAKVQLRNATCPKGHWAAARFVADPSSNDPTRWDEENAIIASEMRDLPPDEAEYALSSRWSSEGRTA
ncbi:MAG: hypothetical protein ACOY82_14140 [Pseudomonadota bacterium]